MKKTLAGIMLASALFLGACSSEQQATPAPVTVTATPETVTEAPPTIEPQDEMPPQISQEEAIYLLRQHSPYFDVVNDSQLIELFESICGALDRGGSVEEIVGAALDNGMPGRETGTLMAVATVSTCYHHVDTVQDHINSN